MNIDFQISNDQLNDLGRAVLASIVSIPLLTENDILRPRLIEKLDQNSRYKLTLITAPAGFGKTTLASGWVHHRSIKAAWVSLDSASNDLLSLWIDISHAIDRQFPGFASIAVPILRSSRGTATETAISFFMHELSRISEPFVLILDDYHIIANTAVHNSLSFVIEHMPEHIQLIIISRAIPPLPLPRLRVRKRMLQIDANYCYVSSGIGTRHIFH